MMPNLTDARIKPTLKAEFLEQVKNDDALKGIIAQKVNRSVFTVQRWIRQAIEGHRGGANLASPAVVDVIRHYLNLSPKVEITETK